MRDGERVKMFPSWIVREGEGDNEVACYFD